MEPEDFIAVLGFGTHEFENARHFENFIKYLFSQSRWHQPNARTRHNAVSERGASAPYWNLEPRENSRKMVDVLAPDAERWASLMDDGAYISFVICIDDHLYSNLVEGERNQTGGLELTPIEGSLYDDLVELLGLQALKAEIQKAMGINHAIINWEYAPTPSRLIIEQRCHQAANSVLDGSAYITVSHNDQTDHNSHYHLHRIRDRKVNEIADISQEEIRERNKAWQP
jgi:hypothetical protein